MVTLKPVSKGGREKERWWWWGAGVKREKYRKHAVPMVTQNGGILREEARPKHAHTHTNRHKRHGKKVGNLVVQNPASLPPSPISVRCYNLICITVFMLYDVFMRSLSLLLCGQLVPPTCHL